MKPWVAGIRISKDLLVLQIESVYTVLIFLAGSKTVRIGSGFDPVLVDWKENQIFTIFTILLIVNAFFSSIACDPVVKLIEWGPLAWEIVCSNLSVFF